MTNCYRIGVLVGDGIGEEVVPAAIDVATRVIADSSGLAVEWEYLPMGWQAIRECGDPMPESNKKTLAECDGWVIGPHDSASYPPEWHEQRHRPPGGELRHCFDLYANIRPNRSLPGVSAIADDMDLVIVRENTQGFYPDRNLHRGHGEFMPTPDVAMVVGVFTRPAVERIVRRAYELALSRRRHLTVVHKANVLPSTTGMFSEVAAALQPEYPDVVVDHYHIDAMAALLVRRPGAFDVIVTENMFGDILSDLAGELVGGMGTGASINASDDHAMAQAVHGGAPDIAGQDKANPVGMIMSVAMLLQWLGHRRDDRWMIDVAAAVEAGVLSATARGARTPDIGGELGTRATADEIAGDAVAALGER